MTSSKRNRDDLKIIPNSKKSCKISRCFSDFLTTFGQYKLCDFLVEKEMISLRFLNKEIHNYYETHTYTLNKEINLTKEEDLIHILPHIQGNKSIIIDFLIINKNVNLTKPIFSLSETSITILILNEIEFDNSTFTHLLTFLSSHSEKLRGLELRNLRFNEGRIQRVCEINFKRLDSFALSETREVVTLTTQCILSISKLIIANKETLSTINMAGQQISSNDFISIFVPTISQATNLWRLNLSNVGLQDEMIPLLCSVIKKHETLYDLSIFNNRDLSDKSIAMLCNPSLILDSIDISYTKFATKTAQAIIKNDVLSKLYGYPYSQLQFNQILNIIKGNKFIHTFSCMDNDTWYSNTSQNQLLRALLFNSTIRTFYLNDNSDSIIPYGTYEDHFLHKLSLLITKNHQIFYDGL